MLITITVQQWRNLSLAFRKITPQLTLRWQLQFLVKKKQPDLFTSILWLYLCYLYWMLLLCEEEVEIRFLHGHADCRRFGWIYFWRCGRTELLPSWTAPHHFCQAFNATGSNFSQAQGVPKLSFSQIHIQQHLTVGHVQKCQYFHVWKMGLRLQLPLLSLQIFFCWYLRN